MMLRLILVSLVTSMGLELPSDRDISCWAESGRAWANARMCDLMSPGVEVVPASEADVTLAPVDADQTFAAIQSEMAANLAADQAISPAEAIMTANTYCDESPYAGVELVAVGLVDGAEVITEVAVAVAPECDSIATCDEPATVNVADQDDNDATAQAACVAEAVRLTREAAQTWDDLTQESVAETECGR